MDMNCLIFNRGDIMKKYENSRFGVFAYDGNDICLEEISYYSDDIMRALSEAITYVNNLEGKDCYVEVWERDENGLFGNSGEPIYKSDNPLNSKVILSPPIKMVDWWFIKDKGGEEDGDE